VIDEALNMKPEDEDARLARAKILESIENSASREDGREEQPLD
jgi:hypothetical protein